MSAAEDYRLLRESRERTRAAYKPQGEKKYYSKCACCGKLLPLSAEGWRSIYCEKCWEREMT